MSRSLPRGVGCTAAIELLLDAFAASCKALSHMHTTQHIARKASRHCVRPRLIVANDLARVLACMRVRDACELAQLPLSAQHRHELSTAAANASSASVRHASKLARTWW